MVETRDLGIGRLKRELAVMSEHHVVTGSLGDKARAKHPDAEVNVGTVLGFFEYGTKTQPARPFLRRTLEVGGDKLRGKLKRVVSDLIDGRAQTGMDAYEDLSKTVQGVTEETFDTANQWAAPLSEYTVAKKGHDRIGIDSGTARRSLATEVRKR